MQTLHHPSIPACKILNIGLDCIVAILESNVLHLKISIIFDLIIPVYQPEIFALYGHAHSCSFSLMLSAFFGPKELK